MHNNKKHLPPRFLAAAFASVSALGLSGAAEAEIMLYDKDQTTFSTDGYINAFYVNSKVDREGEQFDRRQSRVKMGFLPNYIGFNMGKQVDDLKLGAGVVLGHHQRQRNQRHRYRHRRAPVLRHGGQP
ncbi:hypothetical protein PSEG_02887 [Pseudomonas sp. Nvir]|nr:hypothetical protein PSNVIR_01472 [Pseudomonas sp. Nvir]